MSLLDPCPAQIRFLLPVRFLAPTRSSRLVRFLVLTRFWCLVRFLARIHSWHPVRYLAQIRSWHLVPFPDQIHSSRPDRCPDPTPSRSNSISLFDFYLRASNSVAGPFSFGRNR